MNKGIIFENKCIVKLQQLGFTDVQETPITDYGADIVAYYKGVKYIFQCKYCKQKQGVSAVQEILTAKQFYQADRCAVVSRSGYTNQAYKLAKPNFILLISEEELFNSNEIHSLFIDSINQMQSIKPITHNYDIIQEFERTKQALGHTPTLPELDKTLRYRINKQYKNYKSFLTSIGERFKNSKPTNEQLRAEYIRIRGLLGQVPSAKEIKNYTNLPYNSFHQYPLTRLQKECGDKPLCDRSATEEDLIAEYKRLELQLGRPPNSCDIDQYGKYNSMLYFRKFGSLANFYNDPRVNASRLVPKKMTYRRLIVLHSLIEYLLNNSQDAYVNSGSLKRIQIDGEPILTPNNIDYRFGNFHKFISFIESDGDTLLFRKELVELINNYMDKDQTIISPHKTQ